MIRLCLILILGAASAQADTRVRIAAASNLVHVIEALTAEFRDENPATITEVTLGSSGNLVAQIAHGAPFDIFLSADMDYPRALIAHDQADPASLTPFAIGRLALWTTNSEIQLTHHETALTDSHVRRIAIANPDVAPYGRAALEILEKLNLASELRPKIVVGENISQTAQFVASGNADLGFVALSIVLSPRLDQRGQWIEVPTGWHAPLAQGAVITKHGWKKPASREFLAFLTSPTARKIFARSGYHVPAQP